MASKDPLQKLRDQRAKLLEAAKQNRMKERRLERQQNARRRDLLGGMVLELMESGEWPKERILPRLDTYFTRAADRALFDLPPRPPQDAPSRDTATEQPEPSTAPDGHPHDGPTQP